MNSHLSFITNGEGKGYKFLLLPTAVQFAILAAHFLFVYAPWNDLSGSATVDTLVCLSGTIACSFVFAVGENGFALLFYGSLVEKLIMLSRSLSENSRITRAPVNSFGVYRLAAWPYAR